MHTYSPVHSLILDVDDMMWIDDGYFTEEEMNEIKNEACPKDYDLPEKLDKYLKGYIGKVSTQIGDLGLNTTKGSKLFQI